MAAGEIKKLAEQSGEASKQINELIKIIQEEIYNSSNSIADGVVQARSCVNAVSKVEAYLKKLFNSNEEVNSKVKKVEEGILNINYDTKQV